MFVTNALQPSSFYPQHFWTNKQHCSQSTTNKMQHFSIYLFLLDALHVSDGFSVHHWEIKTAHTASSIGLTNTRHCTCSFELPMMDGKNRLKHVGHLTGINKLRNVTPCWLYSANTLATHGPMHVKQHGLAYFIQYIQGNSSKMTSLRHFPPKTPEHLTCTSLLKRIFCTSKKSSRCNEFFTSLLIVF